MSKPFPGYGDSVTWPRCTGDPLDPRTTYHEEGRYNLYFGCPVCKVRWVITVPEVKGDIANNCPECDWEYRPYFTEYFTVDVPNES